MAKNRVLRPRTVNDIDQKVERVLRGLGNPKPPLELGQVRELLKLDLTFYSSDDPGLLRETISRIRVASIQIYKRPTLLIDAIKSLSLSAIYIPDQKRILLDKSIPEKKHRWSEAHEIGHSIIPWHDEMMLGDNAQTLSFDCHAQIEAEANYAAGRLLFLREEFTQQVSDLNYDFSTVQALQKEFGNSLSSTLWRFVETAGIDRPLIGLISCHPHVAKRPVDFNSESPCRHFIQSSAFAARFGKITEIELFNFLAGYCAPRNGGPLGMAEVALPDDNGQEHLFKFETFFNRYDALTLGVYMCPRSRISAQ